jgi:hypothetical protein
MYAKKETVIGDKANVEGEKNEKFLVLLPNTIVHPGTMVVHLFDAPLAYRPVMCSLWLDATALGAFEDNLSLLKSHSLNVLLCCISFRYSSGICEHSAKMRADSKEMQQRRTFKEWDLRRDRLSSNAPSAVASSQREHITVLYARGASKRWTTIVPG